MPKRTDISSILIIGAGPIVIGQACEFDYSGAQACKALKEEGYRIVLVNSNPATIMTDPGLADATYIEPITPEIVEQIIAARAARRAAADDGRADRAQHRDGLARTGALERHRRRLDRRRARRAIAKAEDRQLFREAMDRIGLARRKSRLAQLASRRRARRCRRSACRRSSARPSRWAAPAAASPTTRRNSRTIVPRRPRASPAREVLVEESVLGWKEFEMEVVRDKARQLHHHLLDRECRSDGRAYRRFSVTVAPALTLTDKEYQIMRNASIAVLREIGVDTGGSNVQFAVNPADGRLVVIEMNPRVSRSSALASKATGFPIAKIAAKLAVGYTLDELMNEITGTTPGVVRADDRLRRHQDAALHLREIPGRRAAPHHLDEIGRRGDGDRPQLRRIGAEGAALDGDRPDRLQRGRDPGRARRRQERDRAPSWPSPRPTGCSSSPQAYRARAHHGRDPRRLQIRSLVPRGDPRDRRGGGGGSAARTACRRDAERGCCALKRMGFSDARLAELAKLDEAEVAALARAARHPPGLSSASTPAPPSSPRSRPTCTRCYEGDGFGRARMRGRSDRAATRSSSSAAARTGSARASSSTIAASMPPTPQGGRHRDHHGQLQPRDRLDRLRHLRPALFRAADRRGRDRDRARRAAERQGCSGVIVQFGGQTPAEARAGARGGRHPDPRHLARRDRPRRGPPPLPAAAAAARPAPAGQRHRHLGRRGRGGSGADRLSGGDPAVLRAGRPRDGDRPRRRPGSTRYMRSAVKVSGTQPGADRPLSAGRDRGRCRCAGRRHARLRRRHHGAYRGGRHPFRRQRLLAAALYAAARDRSPRSSARPRRSPARSTSSG